MITPEEMGKVIESDVLVIGGGVAGLWAANRAREFVDDVLVVDKGAGIGRSGQGYFSNGFIQVLPPGEDIADYINDMVYLNDGLCDQELFEKVFTESLDRVKDYQRLGMGFASEENGKLRSIPQRGLNHNACYVGKPFGHGGKAMMTALADEANSLGIKYLSRIYVTDLLKRDGQVVGAVGFNTRDGQFYTFKARATILCTGSCSMKSPYEDQLMATGNGYEIALKAGASVKNAEFAMMWVIPKKFVWEGVTALLPLGAEFVNKNGEHFMNKYSPSLKSNCDYGFVVRAMAIEAMEGRGPFYLDCSGLTPENKELMTPRIGWMKLQYDRLLKAGIRPFEERQEWMPCFNQIAASVVVDPEMRTGVPGLFVAGSLTHVESGVHVGGMSLLPCAVLGRCAGESAAKYAKSHTMLQVDEEQVSDLKEQCFARLGQTGINPEQVITEVRKVISIYDVCVLKSDTGLRAALAKIESIRDNLLPEMDAQDLHYLGKSKDTRSITLMAEMFLRASLLRTESRTSHYRVDYPSRNDKSWLKWIMISYNNRKLSLRTEYLPVERYKLKTWHYYSDNFKFPKTI